MTSSIAVHESGHIIFDNSLSFVAAVTLTHRSADHWTVHATPDSNSFAWNDHQRLGALMAGMIAECLHAGMTPEQINYDVMLQSQRHGETDIKKAEPLLAEMSDAELQALIQAVAEVIQPKLATVAAMIENNMAKISQGFTAKLDADGRILEITVSPFSELEQLKSQLAASLIAMASGALDVTLIAENGQITGHPCWTEKSDGDAILNATAACDYLLHDDTSLIRLLPVERQAALIRFVDNNIRPALDAVPEAHLNMVLKILQHTGQLSFSSFSNQIKIMATANTVN